MYIWQILKINLIYPQGKICIKNVCCVCHVLFLVGVGGEGEASINVYYSLMESMFNFDVVLSTLSDSTFAMILITKA